MAIKRSIPPEGTLEQIVPVIFKHDQQAHAGDGVVHMECPECKELCRRCLAALGMTPQDYLDSFNDLPTVSLGGHTRPEILKEVAEILVLESAAKRVLNPWDHLKEPTDDRS